MFTKEQKKALLEEIEKLRLDKAALISRGFSLEQSLYWLPEKVFGRMSEKSLPLDPNQLFLFSKEEISSMKISRLEEEVRKSEEEITRTIKVKEKPVRKCMAGSSVLTDIVIGKSMYHLQFYRLMHQYRESGISISESAMCGWYEMAVEKLKLLYNLFKQKMLSSEYIQVDESVIPVMDNEKHKTKKGMSGACAMASRETSCSIMTVTAVRV